jgi:hypothetical protein
MGAQGGAGVFGVCGGCGVERGEGRQHSGFLENVVWDGLER